MTITPEQADRLKKNAIPGPWKVRRDEYYESDTGAYSVTEEVTAGGKSLFGQSDDMMLIDFPGNLPLAAAAPDMAETIAGMAEKWGFELDGAIVWMNDRAMAEDAVEGIEAGRVVRQLVGPVEVIDGE